jgi:hypothetical protein
MNGHLDNDKPQYLDSADLIGGEIGVGGQELLRRIRATSLSADYPTAECFLPHEISEYEDTGQMPNDRLAHEKTCPNCRALLSALRPDQGLISDLRDAVHHHWKAPSPPDKIDTATIVAVPRKITAGRWPIAAAAAVVLCSGAISVGVWRHSSRSVAVAPTRIPTTVDAFQVQQLVFVNETSKKQITLQLEILEDGRISIRSYPEAAAATALVNEPLLLRSSSAKSDPEERSGDLSNKVVSALASVCGPPTRVSFGSKVHDNLEQALRDQQVEVSLVSSSSNNLLVNYRGDSATLEPTQAVSSTKHFCKLLHQSAGDVASLDKSAKNVQIKVASMQ